MTSVEITSLVLNAFLIVLVVAITSLFLKSQRVMLAHTERAHERSVAQQKGLLDRLMAMDFQTFKSYEMAQNAPQGGYEDPEPMELAVVHKLEGLE